MGSRETLALHTTLAGHAGWVTALATTAEQPNLLLSASRGNNLNFLPEIVAAEIVTIITQYRGVYKHHHMTTLIDRTIMMWQINGSDQNWGTPKRSLKGYQSISQK